MNLLPPHLPTAVTLSSPAYFLTIHSHEPTAATFPYSCYALLSSVLPYSSFLLCGHSLYNNVGSDNVMTSLLTVALGCLTRARGGWRKMKHLAEWKSPSLEGFVSTVSSPRIGMSLIRIQNIRGNLIFVSRSVFRTFKIEGARTGQTTRSHHAHFP